MSQQYKENVREVRRLAGRAKENCKFLTIEEMGLRNWDVWRIIKTQRRKSVTFMPPGWTRDSLSRVPSFGLP